MKNQKEADDEKKINCNDLCINIESIMHDSVKFPIKRFRRQFRKCKCCNTKISNDLGNNANRLILLIFIILFDGYRSRY